MTAEGPRCEDCKRLLRDPVSVAAGRGPKCRRGLKPRAGPAEAVPVGQLARAGRADPAELEAAGQLPLPGVPEAAL